MSGERDAYGVANPLIEKDANAYRAAYGSCPGKPGLSDAQMQRVGHFVRDHLIGVNGSGNIKSFKGDLD